MGLVQGWVEVGEMEAELLEVGLIELGTGRRWFGGVGLGVPSC